MLIYHIQAEIVIYCMETRVQQWVSPLRASLVSMVVNRLMEIEGQL